MKKIFLYSLLLIVNVLLLSQTREEKLQQLKSRNDIKVTEVEKDILKLEYPNGNVMYKNIGDYNYPESGISYQVSPTFDSTIIDLRTIDTIPYYQKYSIWQEVLIANMAPDYIVVGDINKNGRAELYGFVKDYTSGYSDVVVKELNEGVSFDSLHSYQNTSRAVSVYDIDNDGNLELQIRREDYDSVGHWAIDTQLFFKKNDENSIATDLTSVLRIQRENVAHHNPRFANLDGDQYTDFVSVNLGQGNILVFEYNPATNNLDSVYFYDLQSIALYFLGFAIGDYDLDSKPEFFIGSGSGKVVGFESTEDNSYQLIWVSEVPTKNAFLFAETDDIDGNGKKEFWIGGDTFISGEPVTRLTCFEAAGDNTYEAVTRIDILGFFSFFGFNMLALDIDKDGVDELVLCLSQTVIILKFNGSLNSHSYEIYYIKRNERAMSGENSVYWNATMFDINSDDKAEILITADHVIQDVGIRYFTQILKAAGPDEISNEDESNPSFELYQNYPNPFNSETQVKFELKSGANTTLKVYNILGKEIKILLNEYLPSGNYTIDWEASDESESTLSSGIYFIKLSSGEFNKTIKAVLLK